MLFCEPPLLIGSCGSRGSGTYGWTDLASRCPDPRRRHARDSLPARGCYARLLFDVDPSVVRGDGHLLGLGDVGDQDVEPAWDYVAVDHLLVGADLGEC